MKRQSILYKCIFTVVLVSALFLHSSVALAETALSERTYTLGEDKSFSSGTDTSTFWELPQLRPGETRSEGRLTLVNESGKEETIALLRVELPYDDTAALAYLDALHLKVENSDTVVYDGAYSRVMDQEGRLQLAAFDLEDGGSETYTITLSCDFNYTGTAELSSPLIWKFGTSVASGSSVKLPGVLAVVCVSGGILALGAVLAVVSGRRDRSRRREDEVG